ncbi:hypothetical protein EDD36DRAFT_196875 [Exophiala viscosa]|uniref:Uncharacterized protein n=1 Tax=Exophiala viscosa TaxID=2486360 RepID=A0AAN6IFM4_9EURO|nr:hypothetical protein EDD36DRAFT_196875 [Exophiala viscosa]
MCFSCGSWWNRPMMLASEPVQKEYIFLDDDVQFYEDRRTGIHPPAPVYQSNQPAQQAMYYFQGSSSSPAGYYLNGLYYGTSPPTSYAPNSIPYASYAPWTQTAAPAQAAAAVAANAALAQMPNAPAYFVGSTSAEIQAQNAIYMAHMAASQSQPTMLAPYKPGSSPQFWCKELDGSWTLREYGDTMKGDFPAGHWERHQTSGYYYYVRHSS